MKRRSTLTPTTSQKQEASLSAFFVSLRVRPSLRSFLPFYSLLFGFPLGLACSRPTAPPTAIRAHTAQQAVWNSLPQAEDWLKEIQQPPSPLPSQPCDRCERSIRRKLASIRVPPYPLPPDPSPARILLVLRLQGFDLWINGRAITQGCNLWGSLLMQNPILPTLPQSTLQRDPNALATCFQEVRRRHPREQRILLVSHPHISAKTILSLRNTLSNIPIVPPFRFFARKRLPPSIHTPKRPHHRRLQKNGNMITPKRPHHRLLQNTPHTPTPKRPHHRLLQNRLSFPQTSTRPSRK